MPMYKVFVEGQSRPFGVDAESETLARMRAERKGHKIVRVEPVEVMETLRAAPRDDDPDEVGELHATGAVHDAEMIEMVRQIRDSLKKLEVRVTPGEAWWLFDRRKFAATLGINILVGAFLAIVLGFLVFSMCVALNADPREF